MDSIGTIFNVHSRVYPWSITNIPDQIEEFLRQNPRHREFYERTLQKCPLDFVKPGTLIGIEIEVENITLHSVAGHIPPVWQVKTDGSLRNNGVEFVSSAMRPADVFPSLAILYGYMQAVKLTPDFSWRTSTHVHLEAYKLSIPQFKRLLLLYFIFEGALFEFANPGRRETNIFCTPLTRTNFYPLAEFIDCAEDKEKLKKTFDSLCLVLRKYSALNLAHMYDFGTIEARHMRGTENVEFLSKWVALLLELFNSAINITDADLALDVSRLNTASSYDEFTEKIFGDKKDCLLSPINPALLSRGISLVKEILYGGKLIKETRFSKTGGLAKFLDLTEKQSKSDHLMRKVRQPKALFVEQGEV